MRIVELFAAGGPADVLTRVLAGHVPVMFDNASSAIANIKAGRVRALGREVREAVNSAEYRERLAALDMQPRVSSSQELADYLKTDLAKWARVVREAGIKPE